jgi:hypothetical protein
LHDKTPEFTPQQAREAEAVVRLSYLAAKNGTRTTMDEFKKYANAHGTKHLLDDFDKVVQKNYENIRW